MSYMGKVRPTIALTSDDIEDGAILNVDVNASAAIANSKMASDTTNATNLASGTVADARLGTIPADITSNQTGITSNQDDIALLGFKVAANGSLARYNLVDQSIDAFEDASGVDASASTNEVRDSTNYYSGATSASVTVSGNYDDSGVDGDYSWYKWTTVTAAGSYTTDVAQDYEYLVIAGGGGGGRDNYAPSNRGGAGGGAGGYRTATGFPVAATTISSITVGTGGIAGTSDGAAGAGIDGGDGDDSVFSTITSTGGGGGGGHGTSGTTPGSHTGGSGGGGTNSTVGGAGNTPSTSPVQGYDGGDGETGGTHNGGGGGGSSAVGTDGVNGGSGGGDGGAGTSSSIDGTPTVRAGGGAGTAGGSGGTGGGGNNGYSGTANTGSGGGGDRAPSAAGTGGSGIVIIRRPTDDTAVANMTLVSNAQTAQSAPTNGDLVITYTDGAGTATVNTDIKAYISRDGSAYTSAVTLVSQGTTGGHTILTANGVDLSGITSGTSMRWKIETLNQSVSKDTRVQAVSLGWS